MDIDDKDKHSDVETPKAPEDPTSPSIKAPEKRDGFFDYLEEKHLQHVCSFQDTFIISYLTNFASLQL
jgi:hypothetical protein